MELQEYHILRHVEDSHFRFRSLHELVEQSLRKFLPRDKAVRILDAGCGTGGLMQRLAPFGTVEGVDLSPLAIHYCRERGLQHVRIADLNTVDLPKNHYDAIVCIDVLYHQAVENIPMILRRFHASLTPGGILFLHLPAFELFRSEHDRRVHTKMRFHLKDVKQLLRDAHFEVQHGSYHITLLLPLILLVRMLRAHSRTSDLKRLPSFLNAPLLLLSRFENAVSWLIPLPVGLSLYMIARKPTHHSAI